MCVTLSYIMAVKQDIEYYINRLVRAKLEMGQLFVIWLVLQQK